MARKKAKLKCLEMAPNQKSMHGMDQPGKNLAMSLEVAIKNISRVMSTFLLESMITYSMSRTIRVCLNSFQ